MHVEIQARDVVFSRLQYGAFDTRNISLINHVHHKLLHIQILSNFFVHFASSSNTFAMFFEALQPNLRPLGQFLFTKISLSRLLVCNLQGSTNL